MTLTRRHSLTLVAMLGVSLLTAQAARASSVIYLQNFGSDVNNANFSSVGWTGYGSGNGGSGADGNGVITPNGSLWGGGLSNLTGNPANLADVNATSYTGHASNSLGLGYVYYNSTDPGQSNNFLVYGDTGNGFPITGYTIDSISAYIGSRDAGDTFRAAVKINGSWYATDASVSSPAVGAGGNFASQAIKATWTFSGSGFYDGANWRAVTLTPGGPAVVSLGSAPVGGTLSGNVQAAGLFLNEVGGPGNQSSRFDTFQITGTATTTVPLPSAAYGSAMLLGALAVRKLAKRRHA